MCVQYIEGMHVHVQYIEGMHVYVQYIEGMHVCVQWGGTSEHCDSCQLL